MGNNILITVTGEDTERKDIRDVLRCKDSIEKVICKKNLSASIFFLEKNDFSNIEDIKQKITESNPYCIFNFFEGFSDDALKEAEFAGILEGIKVPFTGNSQYTLKLCLDKQKVKNILDKNGILTPKGYLITCLEDLKNHAFNFPVFIKPCFEDSSLGIDKKSLVFKEKDLYKAVEEKLEIFSNGIIVEEFIPGKEYNVGLLGDYPYELLGISIIDYSKYGEFPPFLTYNSKWEEDSLEFKKILPEINGEISSCLKDKIVDISKKTGEILKCRSYFRVDLREKNGDFFVLDVNPNPDINEDSGFMKQGYSKGYTYEEMINKILSMAIN